MWCQAFEIEFASIIFVKNEDNFEGEFTHTSDFHLFSNTGQIVYGFMFD